ncbi:GntR family transcriptional regulator [Vibrio gazogenes]|uniref:GntR family transcriptional regulator n=1 Tax=Vibrio gazogenes TaxID=687 RepID=UPI0003943CA8|nr:GntR family transcriptional regulator [Vibrio gazogenes]
MDQATDLIQPEKDNTKSEHLTDYLIEAIIQGEIASGSKISEPSLARQFQVSRGPLREALMRLEGLGLIERIPHVGARVIALSYEKLIELYAVREALEGMAARLAARYITPAELSNLETVLEKHARHLSQIEGASYFHQHGDFDFHYCIIKASRNQQLIRLLCDELYHLLRMFRYQSPRAHSQPKEALGEHQFILRAIRERDEELAEMLMRRHIAGSRKLIEVHMLSEQGEQS